MKWYKKQLDMLKIAKEEPAQFANGVVTKKSAEYSFGTKIKKMNHKNFPNPVADSKRSRSKTDA